MTGPHDDTRSDAADESSVMSRVAGALVLIVLIGALWFGVLARKAHNEYRQEPAGTETETPARANGGTE